MNDKCNTKYCRGEVALTYLGTPLCQSCYEKQCDKEGEKEQLKKEMEVLNKRIAEHLGGLFGNK